MGRIIQSDSSGKQRAMLTRSILHACRQYGVKQKTQMEKLDIAAYIYRALLAIEKSIETTVSPWERRDFWVKADKFRMEWSWVGRSAKNLNDAVKVVKLDQIAQIIMELEGRLKNVKLPQQNRLGEPWVGCWELHNKSKKP